MKAKISNANKKTVLVGLSGGVDSSLAVLLLKKQGYNVIGAFMKNFSDIKNPYTGECNYLEDKKMAQKMAAFLNIQFIFIDSEKEYKSLVIDPMYNSYAKGLTPNPDILCNKMIKFPILWKTAKKIKADYIATGHYARIKKTPSGYQLLQGKDKTKDQSYFLSELSENDLSHTLFPVGNLTKSQVRKLAKKYNFPNWDKKGTSGICFVGKVDMKSFLSKKISYKNGKVHSPEGKILGVHQGIQYYTIGQRAGPRIGINLNKNAENKKLYVAKKIGSNLILTPENHPLLKKQLIKINKIHFINKFSKIPSNLKGRIRHLGKLHKGKLIKKSNSYYFKFASPISSVAEGQYLVIYNNNHLVASGEMR
ncbi:MAG: tRNA 2-thiouridine(34) synthase MnmA [Nanoarchaeota archaeon]|nr:tRNA 2-thiouridine(34) synthase MnmA [Nanoarchaeota archaeon]